MCVCVCVQASGPMGRGVIMWYQSLPLAPRKVLPICVTQLYYPSGLPGELSFWRGFPWTHSDVTWKPISGETNQLQYLLKEKTCQTPPPPTFVYIHVPLPQNILLKHVPRPNLRLRKFLRRAVWVAAKAMPPLIFTPTLGYIGCPDS